ncbi:hypothetical protein ANN_22379 [Periplaneta americana]|uniref:Uncharacterized protein n=1 Tax=Periplaneta americana TaxID=6978 RepID=A0ABQ8S7Z4_PERAM|nr:hypothetical protein ANN_22379 [Periplaneta americana]
MHCHKWTSHLAPPMNKISDLTNWLFNDAVSTTRLFSIYETGDSEMIFGEMRPRIRHRLPGIHLTVGENLGKNPTRYSLSKITIIAVPCVILKFKSWSRYHDHLHEPPERTVAANCFRSETTHNLTRALEKGAEDVQGADGRMISGDGSTVNQSSEGQFGINNCGDSRLLDVLDFRSDQSRRLKTLTSSLYVNDATYTIVPCGFSALRALHVERMDKSRNAYRVLVGRPEGKRPFGRLRRRWEYNIKMDLREVESDGRTGLIVLRIGIDDGLM